LVQAACESKLGSLADFALDEEEWYELRVAAWLHDCGKLATPDYIVDKSTKLHLLRDSLSEVNTRFAVLRSQLEKEYLQQIIQNPGQQSVLAQTLAESLSSLEEDRLFLEQSNHGSEYMSPQKQNRIRRIAKRQWLDNHGCCQPMLSNEEVHNLCISRGTLNDEERRLINRHIDITIEMLESLPFPRKLRRVPEYAGAHHEKMDGTGFPRGLTREQMSIPARVMAIADIFEALTAKDRPYKKPMPLSQSLDILKNMRDSNHIDGELYEIFIREKVWLKYARQFMNEEQIDLQSAEVYL
jgi:response regulator RpfG family c-di-GMP phosphodiesterase